MSERDDDEKLREFLRRAHGDDAPPPYGGAHALARALPQPRARRRPAALVLAPVAALALALAIVMLRPRPRPIAAEALRIEWNDPLAFLLEPPGGDVLTTVPRFERLPAPQGGLP